LLKRLFKVLYIINNFLFAISIPMMISAWSYSPSQSNVALGVVFFITANIILVILQYIIYGFLNPLKLFKRENKEKQ